MYEHYKPTEKSYPVTYTYLLVNWRIPVSYRYIFTAGYLLACFCHLALLFYKFFNGRGHSGYRSLFILLKHIFVTVWFWVVRYFLEQLLSQYPCTLWTGSCSDVPLQHYSLPSMFSHGPQFPYDLLLRGQLGKGDMQSWLLWYPLNNPPWLLQGLLLLRLRGLSWSLDSHFLRSGWRYNSVI
jgi:hypothetical protein